MPFTDEIVQFINESLKASSLKDRRFQAGKLYSVVSVVAKKKKDDTLALFPAVCSIDGEFTTVEPNDKYPLIAYHKIGNTKYSFDKDNSYGDGFSVVATSDMTLTVWANNKMTKITTSQLEAIFLIGFPLFGSKTLKQSLGISSCIIRPVGSETDPLKVFRTEYTNGDYFLKPYHSFFQIRYQVEASFSKECLAKCGC